MLAVCLKCHLLSLPAYTPALAANRSLVPFCSLGMPGVPKKTEQAWGVSACRGLLIPGRCSSPDVEPPLRLTI